jgi:hypothetical protein
MQKLSIPADNQVAVIQVSKAPLVELQRNLNLKHPTIDGTDKIFFAYPGSHETRRDSCTMPDERRRFTRSPLPYEADHRRCHENFGVRSYVRRTHPEDDRSPVPQVAMIE